MKTILIVDDEPDIREMIRFALENAGFAAQEASYADEARQNILKEMPDLVLLDWMLPGRSGLELARQLKRDAKTRNLPIIMLTARTEEQDKIQGLNVGADDFVTKPFSPKELIARIHAVLRRVKPDRTGEMLNLRSLTLDPTSHRVMIDTKTLDMSPTEFRLLQFFLTHPERAFTRSQLLDQVWGNDVYVEERTVDVHIRRLRKLLEPFGYDELIQTVRGVGYRLSDQD